MSFLCLLSINERQIRWTFYKSKCSVKLNKHAPHAELNDLCRVSTLFEGDMPVIHNQKKGYLLAYDCADLLTGSRTDDGWRNSIWLWMQYQSTCYTHASLPIERNRCVIQLNLRSAAPIIQRDHSLAVQCNKSNTLDNWLLASEHLSSSSNNITTVSPRNRLICERLKPRNRF